MKKYVICVMLTLVVLAPAAWSKSDNLYESASHKAVVNVKIEQFSVDENCKEINGEDVVRAFEKVLSGRKSVTFSIVDNLKDADFLISWDIKKFVYSKTDPIDVLIPIGLVIDLAVNQNYARLEFHASVYDTSKNRVVWENDLKATLTESDMPLEKSIPLIIERAAKVFVRECFGRPH